MLTENSILALLLSPKPTFSPTCTFHTFLPFIFYFPLRRTSCTQPHFSTPNSTPTTFSRFSTFSFDARHILTKHEVSALSGFVLSQNRFISHTLTLSRFRFRRAALFGTSGFSNSIFRLNICCSERFAAQKGCLLSSSTPRIASGTRSCEFQPRNEINQSATRLFINNTPARVIFCENTGSSLHAKYANRIQYQSDFQASNKQKYVDSKDSCSSLALQL
jgi:hypothetical protein